MEKNALERQLVKSKREKVMPYISIAELPWISFTHPVTGEEHAIIDFVFMPVPKFYESTPDGNKARTDLLVAHLEGGQFAIISLITQKPFLWFAFREDLIQEGDEIVDFAVP